MRIFLKHVSRRCDEENDTKHWRLPSIGIHAPIQVRFGAENTKGCLFLTETNKTNITIMAWISNKTHVKQWDVIIHPYSTFNEGLFKPPLGQIILSHSGCNYLCIPCSQLNHVSKRGTRHNANRWNQHIYLTRRLNVMLTVLQYNNSLFRTC